MAYQQRWKVAKVALASRVVLLLAMSLSCAILPDFYPGDDVLQFDLRLSTPSSSPSTENERVCFCLRGHGCDPEWKSRRRRFDGSTLCADSAITHGIYREHNIAARYTWLDRFYAFILPPVTKWDAARFLTLSADPWARYPPQWPINDDNISNYNQQNDQTCNNDNAISCEEQYPSSEQAHAFLPLLPLSIRYTANFSMHAMPLNILPSTYEATLALSAVIINMVAFVIAAISLFDLTISILKIDASEEKKSNTSECTGDDSEASHHSLAMITAQLFCINPAGVFFTTAYSESIFAMLTFTGHAIIARGQYYQCCLQNRIIQDPDGQKDHGSSLCWWSNLYWIPSTLLWMLLWMLASYSRSNGTFSSIWMAIVGLARCCSCVTMNQSLIKCLSVLLFHGILASLVAYPVHYHDQLGHNFHCLDTIQRPAWCHHVGTGRTFSLYAYVQRKHWNVGLFRYYEMKQIPNFILALPVLALCFVATTSWIRRSWSRHMGCAPRSNEGESSGSGSVMKRPFRWAFLALSASSDDFLPHCRHQEKEGNSSTLDNMNLPMLLLGRKFLSYYAILAGFAFIGAFLAHVQISTRLICSSCPAFYWFASALVLGGSGNNGMVLYSYFALYNILGVIMHVNWLPWT